MTPTKKVFCFIVLFLKAALISYTTFSTDAIPLNLTSEMRPMTSFVTVSNKALLMFNGDLTSVFKLTEVLTTCYLTPTVVSFDKFEATVKSFNLTGFERLSFEYFPGLVSHHYITERL